MDLNYQEDQGDHDGDSDDELAEATQILQSHGVSWSRLTHVESTPLVATMELSKIRGPQQGAALMKRTTKYVAFDVHQATTAVDAALIR